MTETNYPHPLDALTAEFFGGTTPETYTVETLQEALIRQAVQCHAMIRLEFTRAIEPEHVREETPDGREDTYNRVTSLADIIKVLSGAAQPVPDAALKRYTAAAAAPPAPPRWPHEAYCDATGRFDPELFNDVQATPDSDLHGSRVLFGYPPFTGQPVKPYRT